MNDASSSSRTFVASLHPLAARFNLKPHLADITLANVLAGDTCAPISLADFEKYLTFAEYSVENLQFLVWFQDYRDRYVKCDRGETKSFSFCAPSNAQTERRAVESLAKLAQVGNDQEDASLSEYLPASPKIGADVVESPTSASATLPPRYTQLTVPALAYIPASNVRSTDTLEFRAECMRAVATFLNPGAAKELSLDAIVRDTVIRNVSLDYHPDVFLPVYEEIYSLVERFSLPRFLSAASANINLPKQIYWYIVGLTNMTIGIFLALLLITLVPTPPQANRAWRIFPVGFFTLGSAQFYSAWRGYCSQVWMRGSTQLRVWEMQDMDAEANAFVDRILAPHMLRLTRMRGGASVADVAAPSPQSEKPRAPPQPKHDVAAIAPFTRPQRSSDTVPSYASSTTGVGMAKHHELHQFERPPVFGPEAVVLDPRIKAVHRQLMVEVCRFGIYFMLAFSALVFAVPSRL